VCARQQFSPEYETFHGPCGENDACEAGQRCWVGRVCDPNIQRAEPRGRTLPIIIRPPRAGCSCRAGGGPNSASWLVAAIIALAIRTRARARSDRARCRQIVSARIETTAIPPWERTATRS
jgi:MYXO-CTERM domain-containing protein